MIYGEADMNKSYYHCYATANEKRLYLADFENLLRMKKMEAGVDHVFLYVAVSLVRKKSAFDKLFEKVVRAVFFNHPNITLKEIVFKTNVGRDFSSFAIMNEKITQQATDEDFIFFQNRSGRGPYMANWYLRFINQYTKFPYVALCGSTINFLDHPRRSDRNDLPHIQTYTFLTKAKYSKLLVPDFPAKMETNRFEIIGKGEIGLSKFFLDQGLKISCLEWPDSVVSKHTQAFSQLDVKEEVAQEHPFYHRHFLKKKKNRKIKMSSLVLLFMYLSCCAKALLKPKLSSTRS